MKKMHGRSGMAIFVFIEFLLVHLLGVASAFGAYGEDVSWDMDFAPGQIVVKFKAPLVVGEGAKTGLPSIDRLNRRFGVTSLRRVFRAAEPDLALVYEVLFPRKVDVLEVAASYRADPQVAYAEPNYLFHLFHIPNDSLFSHQWALHNIGQEYWGVQRYEGPHNDEQVLKQGLVDADIDAPDAWDQGGGLHPVLVGLIDTGLDFDHPELSGHIWVNADEVPDNGEDDDHNGYVDDYRGWDIAGNVASTRNPPQPDNDPTDPHGHGTHCAGIIAAGTDNEMGVAGVADSARILAIKGFSSSGGALSSWVAEAVVYAADNGAQVISMSWGGLYTSMVLEDALEYAVLKGVFLVAAMGNYKPPLINLDTPIYPAAYDAVMAVGASDSEDHRASFSLYGPHLEVVAPGVDVLSLRAAGTDMYAEFDEPGVHIVAGDYYLANGTSMACPHVAGVGALLLSRSPGMSPDSVRGLIRRTADDLLDPEGDGSSYSGWDLYSGWGRLNAERAASLLPDQRALISSPAEEGMVSGEVQVWGTAVGGDWTLEYGSDVKPTSWTEIASSSAPVERDLLATWETGGLDGRYTVRLQVGEEHEDRVTVRVANTLKVEITSPQAGETVRNYVHIVGSASGPSFTGYRVEYGVGEYPSNWEVIEESTRPEVDTVLALWTLGSVPEGTYTCRVMLETQSQMKADSVTVFVASTYQSGWPREFNSYGQAPVVWGDIDRDGYGEVVMAYKGVYAWNHDGTPAGSWPLHTDKVFSSSPALADLNGDDSLEIVVCCKDCLERGCVCVYRHHGEMATGWPQPVPADMGSGNLGGYPYPIISDIDKDGTPEVVVVGSDNGIYAWNHDGSSFLSGQGGLFASTGVPTPAAQPVPFIGDIEGDGDNEVMALLSWGLFVWNADGTPFAGTNPLFKPFEYISGGALGDIDADSVLEVVVLGYLEGHENITLSAVNADGSEVDGWPIVTPVSILHLAYGLALGDLDEDDRLEVVIGSIVNLEGDGLVCAWRHDGTPYVDPFGTGDGTLALLGSGMPIMADMDDDGSVDIAVRENRFGYRYGKVYAWDREGNLLWGWPQYTSDQFQSLAGPWTPPAIGDLDRDGDLEVIMESLSSSDDKIHVWDLPARYRPDRVEWGMFLHDRWHSGTYGFVPPDEKPAWNFEFRVNKVLAWPGQQHVRVPVFLSTNEFVGDWEILMEYDPSGGIVVGVELCDSVYVDDPEHQGWHYAPWCFDPSLSPEYFNYELNAEGHANWVSVVGVQNVAWPQVVTADIPPGERQLLFCLIFDVTPAWDGHNIVFNFHTKDCTDNSLTSSDGTIQWGPDTSSAPEWTCPGRPIDLRVIELIGGHGVGARQVDRGDINCDGVPYSVADAMMFIGYLLYGDPALQDNSEEYYCGSFEAHCYAADIDGENFCFTVADLILLIRIINGYEVPSPKAAPADLIVRVSRGEVSVDGEIGAARFVFDGEGEVNGEDVVFAHRDGKTIVLAYTLEDRALSGELFTISGDVQLESVDAAGFFGEPMEAKMAFVPNSFALAQNYPNPFNPTTQISYSLPKDCDVKLEIYNILGQRVVTLVDDHQTAGYKSVHWDSRSQTGNEVSSGLYFCRISAGDFVETRKMILLR